MFNGFRGFARMFMDAPQIAPKQDAQEIELLKANSFIEIDNDTDSALISDATYGSMGVTESQTNLQEQAQLINEYRNMALHHDVDSAIDDITNAAISCDSDESPVTLDLERVEVSEKVKEQVIDEFNNILRMLNINTMAYDRFRQWYTDGRQVAHLVLDAKKPADGIKRIVFLDPRGVRRIKEVKKVVNEKTRVEEIGSVRDYYLYDPSFVQFGMGTDGRGRSKTSTFFRSGQVMEINRDAIVLIHSGLVSVDGTCILSNLEMARKPLNNLKMMEDGAVIYRITRAPERRVFNVDTGTLPKKASEEYVARLMNRYRSRMVYDPVSGKVKGNNHVVSMLEDFWLPQAEGGRGTKIDTLPAGANLDQIDDILYFKRLLLESLKIPRSRHDGDATVLIGGRGAEITRDEWKFSKFVERLRGRYSHLFIEILRRQIILKGIASEEEWSELFDGRVRVTYESDNYMKEQQEQEHFANQVNMLSNVKEFIGTYFSRQSIEKLVLGRSDEEILNERKLIAEEIKEGIIADPNAEPDQNSDFQ